MFLISQSIFLAWFPLLCKCQQILSIRIFTFWFLAESFLELSHLLPVLQFPSACAAVHPLWNVCLCWYFYSLHGHSLLYQSIPWSSPRKTSPLSSEGFVKSNLLTRAQNVSENTRTDAPQWTCCVVCTSLFLISPALTTNVTNSAIACNICHVSEPVCGSGHYILVKISIILCKKF